MSTPAPKPSTIPFFGTLLTWQANTVYPLGSRVLNGANIYTVAAQGTSGNAGGPVGNGAGIADPGSPDGLTWNFVVAVTAAWAQTHAYSLGDQVTANGNTYTCIVAGTSSNAGTGPSGTGGVIQDGGAVWSFTAASTAQQTSPTSRVADLGAVPGAPFFAQYFDWLWATLVAWLLYVRDLAGQAWTWTGSHTFSGSPVQFNVAPLLTLGFTSNGVQVSSIAIANTWQLVQEFLDTTTGAQCFVYRGATGEIGTAVNAEWNLSGAGASKWTQIDNANTSSWVVQSVAGVNVYTMAAGNAATPWLDAAWVRQATVGASVVSYTGNVQSTTGSMSAQLGITSATGDVQATLGRLIAGEAISSATLGATQAVPIGDIYKDTAPVAWGKFLVPNAGAPTIGRTANIASIARTAGKAAGSWDVTLQTAPANLLCPVVTAMDTSVGTVLIAPGPTASVFTITYWVGGVLSDTVATGGFFFNVFGG